MATNEPMTDERLANMKEHYRTYGGIRMGELLDEVDLLRAREQALAAENAAMRPVVEAVAKLAARETRENPIYSRDLVLHSDDINVLWLREQARAFVAAHPATDTDTAGEAESEA